VSWGEAPPVSQALAARPEQIDANSFKQELPQFAIISAAAETNSVMAGFSRPSTPLFSLMQQDVDARDKHQQSPKVWSLANEAS
jgi:hypothetical protein